MKTITDTQIQRMLKPVHPSHVLCTEIIDAYHLSVTDAAKILHVSRST